MVYIIDICDYCYELIYYDEKLEIVCESVYINFFILVCSGYFLFFNFYEQLNEFF